jgi:hypothetical protein
MLFILHARLRAHWAPGIPCALWFQKAATKSKTRAKSRRGIAELYLNVIPGRAKREPGIHRYGCSAVERIPGLRQKAHPGMTVE